MSRLFRLLKVKKKVHRTGRLTLFEQRGSDDDTQAVAARLKAWTEWKRERTPARFG